MSFLLYSIINEFSGLRGAAGRPRKRFSRIRHNRIGDQIQAGSPFPGSTYPGSTNPPNNLNPNILETIMSLVNVALLGLGVFLLIGILKALVYIPNNRVGILEKL